MPDNAVRIGTVEELRRYIAETLGRLETLKADQFQLSQNVLYRRGKACGIHFRLQGPRSLCLSAIWETDQNSILFYGSCGRRMQRTKLLQAPAIGS
jgi:hypothetical protein